MQELAYSLAIAVADEELQSQMVAFLKPLDSQIRVDRASLLASHVLDVLLARCHTPGEMDFPVLEITKRVNSILEWQGEMLPVSPETVGRTLRALGLRTRYMTGGNKGLSLSPDVREKIHGLAVAYGVQTLQVLPAIPDCPLCLAVSASQHRSDSGCNVTS